jgi:hypothetical protein
MQADFLQFCMSSMLQLMRLQHSNERRIAGMRKTCGRFDYFIWKVDTQATFAFHPFAVLSLRHWGTTIPGGAPAVSPNLMSAKEIDEYIAMLKDDLDAVGCAAKSGLKRAQEKTLRDVVERSENPEGC